MALLDESTVLSVATAHCSARKRVPLSLWKQREESGAQNRDFHEFLEEFFGPAPVALQQRRIDRCHPVEVTERIVYAVEFPRVRRFLLRLVYVIRSPWVRSQGVHGRSSRRQRSWGNDVADPLDRVERLQRRDQAVAVEVAPGIVGADCLDDGQGIQRRDQAAVVEVPGEIGDVIQVEPLAATGVVRFVGLGDGVAESTIKPRYCMSCETVPGGSPPGSFARDRE